MSTFNFSDLAGNSQALKEAIARDGQVSLVDESGAEYIVRRALGKGRKPLELRGVQTGMTRSEILDTIHEMHAHEPEWLKKMLNRPRPETPTPPREP